MISFLVVVAAAATEKRPKRKDIRQPNIAQFPTMTCLVITRRVVVVVVVRTALFSGDEEKLVIQANGADPNKELFWVVEAEIFVLVVITIHSVFGLGVL